MAWDFSDLEAFFSQFAGPDNWGGAAVFAEWAAADLFDLSDYPPTREDLPPDNDAPINTARRAWVKLNGGAWEQLVDVAQVTNVGVGSVGVLTAGINSQMLIQAWPAKDVGVGYIIGVDSTLEAIQSDADQGVLIVQCSIAPEGTVTQTVGREWDENHIAADLTAYNTWMSAHEVTATQFAQKLGWASPAEAFEWMFAHTRAEFLARVHDQFD